ncbi:hypothetical protein Hdeb2414_s0437g00893591 [Helianthus debilis subsp. tardiflorus]
MYIKTIHFGATWHNFNPLITTWQVNTPLNIDLSGNIHLLCKFPSISHNASSSFHCTIHNFLLQNDFFFHRRLLDCVVMLSVFLIKRCRG